MVLSLLLASCAPAVTEEEEEVVAPPEEEVVAPPEEEEEVAPPEKESRCCEGYTIYCTSDASVNATLVDMNGETVHKWSAAGMPAKMLPGGSILGSKSHRRGKNPLVPDPPGAAKKKAAARPWQDTIEFVQESWDGQIEWSFTNWDDDGTGKMMSRHHHDYQREGNPVGYYAPGQEFVDQGKILILAHKNKVVPEISDKELLDEVIYEVDWNSNLTGFEWHAADHFDEFGFDESAREEI